MAIFNYKYFMIIFSFCFIILVIVIISAEYLFLLRNPYERLSDDRQANATINLEGLPAASIVSAKLNHGAGLNKAYDIGIFGNSRAVMLGAQHIKAIQGRTFFNFAVGGTSFQQSVRSLEYLANHGKAPRVAIISYDNAELQFVGIHYWPAPIFELARFFEDGAILLREDYGTLHQRINDLAKLADHFSGQAWHKFELMWNFNFLLQRLNHFITLWLGSDQGPLSNLPDGSRVQKTPIDQINFETFRPETSMPRAENRFLLIGLRRLTRLAEKHGIRIIIYESPLAPPLALKYMSEPTGPAIETRRWFKRGCRNTILECYPAPIFKTENSNHWPDCCHAPADKLGTFISDIINAPSRP
tara:strand:+ start:2078 stop:3151 length:1074 start_codon:yes stop_codon:yes gene_type:complete